MSEVCIYVVRGDCGEYSDRNEWMVRAFATEQHAQDFAAECTRLYAEAKPGKLDYPWGWKHPLDPDFSYDYTGTRYCVVRVPYTDGAWREAPR